MVSFSQQTLPAYKRTNDSLETTIIQLFQKGITMSEISELIEKKCTGITIRHKPFQI
jgi:transposase-like protein